MLKEDTQWSNHRQYKSKTDWEPIGFFSECLCNSKRFDLMLGFFSSSAIRVLSDSFAMFLYNGGTMRLIINNILSGRDKEAIIAGIEDNQITPFDLSDIISLKKTLSENDKHFFECLAWLIANKKIDIKIIAPKGSIGISHTKSGAFYDEENKVGFNGSCNFTKTALIDNIESIDAFCDWDDAINQAKAENITSTFEKTFLRYDESVVYIEPAELITNITTQFGGKNIEELLEEEKQINQNQSGNKLRPSVKKVLAKAKKQLEYTIEKMKEEQVTPKFPYTQGAREYQQSAFEKWKNNEQCGLFVMATGTGKTITALNCLLEVYKKTGYYKALILVPTVTLVHQWEKECQRFAFTSITKVYATSDWQHDIDEILTLERLEVNSVSYIIIATYASFVRTHTFAKLQQLSPKTLLIADEAHNMGTESMLKLLPKIRNKHFKRRIGLSATPERQYDEEGTKKIFDFFRSANQYTFEYSMEEAIEKNVLCRYFYYPHLVQLTSDEMDAYVKLSVQISHYFNQIEDKFVKKDPVLMALLLKRKRIIHKAENKQTVFREILQNYYKQNGNLKHTLVYVPEGNEVTDYYEMDALDESDSRTNDTEAMHLIDIYTQSVKNLGQRITVRKFVSATGDRATILEQFAQGNIEVLTSMKCLDEGIDVPQAKVAIFCASTGNPRQFVQRRGRILRTHSDKRYAYIHDLVVIPKIDPNSETYHMERSLLRRELERVRDFSILAENSSHAIETFSDIMKYYQLNLYHNDD
jgi:superfamily II DNA or RNA helicase